MDEQTLRLHGFRRFEWNDGLIIEYWKSFHNDDFDFRLGVRFGEFKGVPFIVYIVFPHYMYALRHFTSVEQIEQLLDLLKSEA